MKVESPWNLTQQILDVEAANTDAVIASRLRELGWVKLPERLSRDQAEPICSLTCVQPCDMDCDCNPEVQAAWAVLRERLIND